MGNLLKQAQRMQQAMEEAKTELAEATVEGRAGGGGGAGGVTVTVTGDGRVSAIDLAPEIVASGDKEAIEELMLAALRDGIQRSMQLREERMAKVSGGLNLPGLM